MARLARIIWRLDFDFSWSYVDSMGSMLRAVVETVPKFWDEAHDGQLIRTYGARRKAEDLVCDITIAPQSFYGTVAWPLGTELGVSLNTESFAGLDRIVHELLALSEVNVLRRAGIRFGGVEKRHSRFSVKGTPFGNYVPDNVLAVVTKDYGEVNDVAFILQGKTKDGISYRTQAGPYAEANVRQHIPDITAEQLRAFEGHEMFFDIDLWENDISFREHSLFRWGTTKVESAMTFIKLLQNLG